MVYYITEIYLQTVSHERSHNRKHLEEIRYIYNCKNILNVEYTVIIHTAEVTVKQCHNRQAYLNIKKILTSLHIKSDVSNTNI